MTYKLEPGLSRITSPVVLVFPDHTESFSSGAEVCRVVLDKKWRVAEIRAVEGTVEIKLEEMEMPGNGDETFF